MSHMYDVIVVGARCAGSPTAMLLSRLGYRVLLLDRASFPSDTLSTHYIHQSGIAHLNRWGLLNKLAASNCPPINSYTLDVGPFALQGSPPPTTDGIKDAYAPRRRVLDTILVQAAVEAGAELRERFTVTELTRDGDRVTGIRGHSANGTIITEYAPLVIGADGQRSMVARSVQAQTYNTHPSSTCAYYTYWDGVQISGVELYPRPNRMIIAAPTNDGQTLTIAYWPLAEFHKVRADIETNFIEALNLAPMLAERIRKGKRAERFYGTADLPNFFRHSYGPGWALVGDAGYHKDPILALGISDAFRDTELLAKAIHESFSGSVPLTEALATRQQQRDMLAAPGFESTSQFAQLEPPPPMMQELFAALQHNREQTDRFFGTFAGTVSGQDFFAPDNMGRIFNMVAAL